MFKKSVAMLAVIAGLSATGAEALSLKKGAQPAENPPAGYKGNTYVDSRGCVYVRAGFGGTATWVPRVSRNRQVVCGAKPSLGGSVSASAPKAAPKPAPTPKPAAKPAPAPVVAAKPTVVVPQVKPVPVAPKQTRIERPSVPGPALPPRIGFGPDEVNPALPPRSAPPRPWSDRYSDARVPTVAPVANLSSLAAGEAATIAAPRPQAQAPTRGTAGQMHPTPGQGGKGWIVADNGQSAQAVRVNCPARIGKVAFVQLNGAQLPVRCGPQQGAPVTYLVQDNSGNLTRVTTLPHASNIRSAQAASLGALGGARSKRITSVPTSIVSVPQGNGHAPKTYQVVRGRDLDKAALPPSTVIAPQTYIASNMPVDVPKGYKSAWTDGRLNKLRGVRTIGGDAQTDLIWSDTVPRRLISVQFPDGDQAVASTSAGTLFGQKRARGVVTKPRTSASRKAPITQTRSVSAARASHRYVQVGGFANPANARKVIIKLQRMGLTVSSSTSKSGVKTILAGPFTQQAQLTSALGKVRSAGFRDAFLRK